jgi:hypothetical protein
VYWRPRAACPFILKAKAERNWWDSKIHRKVRLYQAFTGSKTEKSIFIHYSTLRHSPSVLPLHKDLNKLLKITTIGIARMQESHVLNPPDGLGILR